MPSPPRLPRPPRPPGGGSAACYGTLAFGSAPVGALLAGALAAAFGVRPALWVLVVIFALSGTILLNRTILRDRDLPKAPPAASGP
jgi:hypothetical protein